MTDHPLPSLWFTVREQSAHNWVVRHYQDSQWLWLEWPDLNATFRGGYGSIIALAQHLGWEG